MTHAVNGSDDLQPYAMAGLPVFQTVLASNGSWQFLCTCGEVHAHTPGSGPRKSRCEEHRPHGYHLLEPIED